MMRLRQVFTASFLVSFLHPGASYVQLQRHQLSMKVAPMHKMEPERKLRQRGFTCVLGSDETGNGCIAGPVVVATCGLRRGDIDPIPGVKDSKLVSAEDCERIHRIVSSNPDDYVWSIAIASHEDIDETDVPKAAKEATRKSIENLVAEHQLPLETTYSIVDGHKTPKLTIPLKCRPWVKGDAQVYTVALASILAKHKHNKILMQMHELYGKYGFIENKGYPTRDHIVALHTHGASPFHRKTAKPVKNRGTTVSG